MAIKLKNGQYKCPFCDFTGTDFAKVNAHRDTDHVYVLIPMEVSDLNSLIHFIYTKNEDFISPKIVSILQRYLKPEYQINKLKDANSEG